MAKPDKTRRKTPLSHLGELFDASALGLVTLLLLVASFWATWRGMSDFIIGNDLAVSEVSTWLILLVVLTLTLAMYVALREMIAPYYVRGWWSAIWKRLVAGLLYAMLALWSVGFGYGFWWSLIAGQEATETGLTRAVDSFEMEASDVRARLIAAAAVMDRAEALSDRKAELEATRGSTCGVASPPGNGPLARARLETQAQIAAIAASVRGDWLEPMTARIDALSQTVRGGLDKETMPEDRQARFEALDRETRQAASDISSEASARGRTLAAELTSKANQLSSAPSGGRVAYCFDPDLAASLRAAANEIDQDFQINVVSFRFSEGADGVARAVEDLWGGLAQMTGVPVLVNRPAAPPGGRSLIALLAALGVDLALLVFALLRGSPQREWDEQVIEAAPAVPPMPQAALPRPKNTPRPRRGPEPDEVVDAEFEEVDRTRLVPTTFEPDSQQDPEEYVEELLQRVEHHIAAIRAAGSRADSAREQNHLDDALRALRKLGYHAVSQKDVTFDPSLHEVIETREGAGHDGQILHIIRPRFVDDDRKMLRRAKVIISVD